MSKISAFEDSFAQRKAQLLQSLKDPMSEGERKQMIDSFLQQMDQSSLRVLKSQSYAKGQLEN